MEPPLRDRLRVFVADYAVGLAVLFVLCIVVGGGAVYTAQPGTATESTVTDRWAEQGAFSHQAEVTGETPVFERGAILERQLYYTSVSPVLEGAYSYQHSDDSVRTVTMELQVLLQSTREEGVLWQRTKSGQTIEETIGPDEEVVGSWETNVSASQLQIERIQEQLGASLGTPELLVVVEVVTRAENSQPTRHTQTLRVEPNTQTFAVESPDDYSEQTEVVEERTVQTGIDLPYAVGGGVAIVVGVVGAGSLGAMRFRGDISVPERERRRLSYESKRAEFDEWITTGQTATRPAETPAVEVDGVEGLVDVAIDTNQRVIEDSKTGVLSVQTPTTRYQYVPPVGGTDGDGPIRPLDESGTNGHTPTEEMLTQATTDETDLEEQTDGQSRDGSDQQTNGAQKES